VKYVVETPNKLFNGFREGVAFVAGRAEIEDEVLKRGHNKNTSIKRIETFTSPALAFDDNGHNKNTSIKRIETICGSIISIPAILSHNKEDWNDCFPKGFFSFIPQSQ